MTMYGLPMDTFVDNLIKVPAEFEKKPIESFDAMDRVGPVVRDYIAERWDKDAVFADIMHNLPMQAFAKLTFDEVCKLHYSTNIMMDQTVEEQLRENPRYTIYYKINNSMWRWGMKNGTWNEIVDAYNGIRAFDLGPDFEIRLDYTTGWNPHGPATACRKAGRELYLDGVFAFLVHYKGEHVMTIGFSVAGDRKIFIQQIQLVKPQGNRWLFKFPNRVDRVITAFKAAFTGHDIWIADGGDIGKKSIKSYRNSYREAKLAKIKALMVADFHRNDWHRRAIEQANEFMPKFSKKACSLERDLPRLRALYLGEGAYAIDPKGQSIKCNDVRHYPVETA